MYKLFNAAVVPDQHHVHIYLLIYIPTLTFEVWVLIESMRSQVHRLSALKEETWC